MMIEPSSYPVERAQLKQFEAKKQTIKVITLGHSHNLAIDFKHLGIDGFHLWLPGEDIYESYYKLQYYEEKINQLEMVILPIGYFIFADNKFALEFARQRFYDLYPTAFIKNDFYNFLYVKFTLLHKIRLIFRPLPITSQIEADGRTIIPYNFRILSKDSLEIVTAIDIEIHRDILQKTRENETYRERDIIEILSQIIQFAQRKDIRLVLYTPPYFECYNQLFDEVEKQKVKLMMDSLMEVYEVEYYDYSDIDSLSSDPSLFMDDDHLNLSVGTPKFSKMLRDTMAFRNSFFN